MEANEIKTMRFGVLTQKGHAEVRERPLPEMGPEEVLVKQQACNICTTDYQQWLGLREGRGYPMASGHESAGTVVAVGEAVKDLHPGDLVSLAYVTCGICDGCKRGLGCDNNEIGPKKISWDGYRGMFAYADYAVRPARALIKMNRTLDPSEAAFMEPLAAVVKGLEKLRVKPLETVVVVGAGTMGLLNAQAARAMGCRVLVSELMENKLQAAREMGFPVIDGGKCDPVEEVKRLTDGKGADAVILAVAALSGIGDLIVTCTSMHSRNRRAGILIGQGVDPEEAVKQVGTVEGYFCTKAAYELSRKCKICLPITEKCYDVLYNGASPRDAIRELMGRPKRQESEMSLYELK